MLCCVHAQQPALQPEARLRLPVAELPELQHAAFRSGSPAVCRAASAQWPVALRLHPAEGPGAIAEQCLAQPAGKVLVPGAAGREMVAHEEESWALGMAGSTLQDSYCLTSEDSKLLEVSCACA